MAHARSNTAARQVWREQADPTAFSWDLLAPLPDDVPSESDGGGRPRAAPMARPGADNSRGCLTTASRALASDICPSANRRMAACQGTVMSGVVAIGGSIPTRERPSALYRMGLHGNEMQVPENCPRPLWTMRQHTRRRRIQVPSTPQVKYRKIIFEFGPCSKTCSSVADERA